MIRERAWCKYYQQQTMKCNAKRLGGIREKKNSSMFPRFIAIILDEILHCKMQQKIQIFIAHVKKKIAIIAILAIIAIFEILSDWCKIDWCKYWDYVYFIDILCSILYILYIFLMETRRRGKEV